MCERPECQQIQDQLAQTQHLLEKAHDEMLGQAANLSAAGKEIRRLNRELSDESSPLAQDVRRVLDHWGTYHPKAGIGPTGYRAKVVRGAMRLGHTAPPLPCPKHDAPAAGGKRDKDARCSVADELIEAIDGLRLTPFVGRTGRCAVMGPGVKRYDGIEYALTDRKTGAASEATIEKFRNYARWAKYASSEKLYVRYELTGAVYEAYTERLMDALARETKWSKLEATENGAHA